MHGYIVGEILVGAMLAARTDKQNPLTSEEIEEIGQMVVTKILEHLSTFNYNKWTYYLNNGREEGYFWVE